MPEYDAAAYFAVRAPRYQKALQILPHARALDLLPYIAILRATRLDERPIVRVCDAFGGTGFLTRGLQRPNFVFTVVDACKEMLSSAESIVETTCEVTDKDFEDILEKFGPESFDLILCHGGLHHVVELDGAQRRISESRALQAAVCERFAMLLAPSGVLILADIPSEAPPEIIGDVDDQTISTCVLEDYLGRTCSDRLARLLAITDNEAHSLASIRSKIVATLANSVPFPVPRCFFDEYVQDTPLGHVAVYPIFGELHRTLTAHKLECISRINYRGPWVFHSEEEAGWFFREKFSIGPDSKPGQFPKDDRVMFGNLERFLGIRSTEAVTSVNWGVTYAAYEKVTEAR